MNGPSAALPALDPSAGDVRPLYNKHCLADPMCRVLLGAASNKRQLQIAVETIDRIHGKRIERHRPDPKPKKAEPTPAFLRCCQSIAKGGNVDEILRLAGISKTFRERFSAAVKWAEKKREIANSQRSTTP